MSVSKAKFEQKGGDYVPKQDASRKRAKKKVRLGAGTGALELGGGVLTGGSACLPP